MATEEIQKVRKRYAVLDGIRGLALLNMMIYHGVWDLVYLFGMDWQWYRSDGAFVWQQCICWTFIFLSGFCHPLGKRKLRRGILVLLAGALISFVTVLVMPQSQVLFGVLTLIGTCTLVMLAAEKMLDKCPASIGLLVSVVLFVITRNVNSGCLGFGDWCLWKLPESWYSNWVTTFLGFPMQGFRSTDYFSLFPWIFLFATGYFTYRLLQGQQLLVHLEQGKVRVLEWLGRHSLGIYMVHQPVIYGVLSVFFMIIK